MRLIDADALKVVFEEKSSEAVCGVELCKAIISRIDEAPTVDAVPSETLHNFIRKIGAITYGKERFFYEDGVWYDRESCEWVTTQTAIEACLKAVRELDDSVIDAVPVRHAHWIKDADDSLFMCSHCKRTEHVPTLLGKPDIWKYCPHCGARMDKDGIQK